MTTKLVLFKDTLEENSTPHFGILINDEYVICFCCGGVIEKEDYKILETFSFEGLEETIKNHF